MFVAPSLNSNIVRLLDPFLEVTLYFVYIIFQHVLYLIRFLYVLHISFSMFDMNLLVTAVALVVNINGNSQISSIIDIL